jgi:hypothetical protein
VLGFEAIEGLANQVLFGGHDIINFHLQVVCTQPLCKSLCACTVRQSVLVLC